MFNSILLKYNKYKSKFFSNLFFFFFIIVFLCSVNFLEEDIFIGIFSNLILGFLVFILRELKAESARQNRKRIKKVFRMQRDFLKRYYFYFYKLLKINFRYIKKITFNYFLIKCTKLFIKLNLNLKFYFYKVIYIKTYILNFIILFLFKFFNKLLELSK